MSLQFLLDTNVLAELLRPEPRESVLKNFRQHHAEIGIAAVVWHEMLYGCYRLHPSRKRTAIEAFLFEVVAPTLPILPYDEHAARWHAAERVRLTQAGKTPAFADGQIAAIAAVNDLTLVTFNLRDFDEFRGLRVTGW